MTDYNTARFVALIGSIGDALTTLISSIISTYLYVTAFRVDFDEGYTSTSFENMFLSYGTLSTLSIISLALSSLGLIFWALVLIGTYLLARSYGGVGVGRNIVFYALSVWLIFPLLIIIALFFFFAGLTISPALFVIAALSLIGGLFAMAFSGYFLYRAYDELSKASGEGLLRVLGIMHLVHAVAIATIIGLLIGSLVSFAIIIIRVVAFYNLKPPTPPQLTPPQSPSSGFSAAPQAASQPP